MAKDHGLRGASKYDPGGCEGGESCPMSSERKEEKPSQAVAVCGESRTHGDNGGDGKTQFGCASRPYPLKSGEQIFLALHDIFSPRCIGRAGASITRRLILRLSV